MYFDAKSAVPVLPASEVSIPLSCQFEASSKSFFDRQATNWADRYESATYKQRRHLVSKLVRSEVKRLNRPTSTIKLLDFGCGSGVLLKDAATLGLQVTGVDNSKAMIDAARCRLVDFNVQVNLEWLPSSSGEGSYELQNYDIVVCFSVLEFILDWQPLLVRLCARVTPGGLFILSVPNQYSWLRMLEKFIHHYPRVFRRFSALDHLTGNDSYLNHQAHQFARTDLLHLVRNQSLKEETRRFHVAPGLLSGADFLERIGMMLMMSFRQMTP